ncbi:MAG: pyruvate ferredoxin oxidoreductase [Desulfobacteraceae bacterium]|nr:MAG: pyruvate ferredoxin oxidoreductase [Desulfobacteraceae bacterium]
MKNFNIYLTGVGGQGIGLLSEILLRAADKAGYPVKGTDTHGLAQRGGIVASRIRIGDKVHSPLIPEGEADLVVALERHEALRGMNLALRDGGTLVYYDAVWQPLPVRLGLSDEISENLIRQECRKRKITGIKVFHENLSDARMQNIALLRVIHQNKLIPELTAEHYRASMEDLMEGTMLQKNLEFFSAPATE